MRKRKVIKEGLLSSLASLFMTAATKAELRNDPEFKDWFEKNHKRLKQLNKEIAAFEKEMQTWK